ncbi:MAG: ATP-binding protein, partial [Gemmatimonadales bacterium]
ISPEQQEVIFDAFARANSRVGGGTGLGLTLSRRLAVMLGGDLTVQSRLGEGARFTVTIGRYL